MNIDWTSIILAIIGLLSAVVTGFLIPFLKAKLTEEQLTKAKMWLKVFVSAAETAMQNGADKKAWVLAQMDALGIKMTEEQLDSCLEAVVRELTAMHIINVGK